MRLANAAAAQGELAARFVVGAARLRLGAAMLSLGELGEFVRDRYPGFGAGIPEAEELALGPEFEAEHVARVGDRAVIPDDLLPDEAPVAAAEGDDDARRLLLAR